MMELVVRVMLDELLARYTASLAKLIGSLKCDADEEGRWNCIVRYI